jgi:hypothetical protein
METTEPVAYEPQPAGAPIEDEEPKPVVQEQLPKHTSIFTHPPPGFTFHLESMKQRVIQKKKSEGRYAEPVMNVGGKDYVFYTDKDGFTNFRLAGGWEPVGQTEETPNPITGGGDRPGGSGDGQGTSGLECHDRESATGGSGTGSGDDTSSS